MNTAVVCILCVLAAILMAAYLEEKNRRLEIESVIHNIPGSTYHVISAEDTVTTSDGTRGGFIEVCASFTTKRECVKVVIHRFEFISGDHKSLGEAIDKAEALVKYLNNLDS